MINHRIIGLAAGLALAGCATGTPITPASVANDVILLSTSLTNAEPAIQKLHNVDLTAINLAIGDLQGAAQSIIAADQPTQKVLVIRVEGDVNAVLAGLQTANPPLPANLQNVVTAINVLLPIVEADIGVIVPAKASPLGHGMSPATAREVLRGAH